MEKQNKTRKNKNPWVAGVLNIIPGLGYLYLGKRKGLKQSTKLII